METIASLGLTGAFEASARESRFWNDNYQRLLVEYPDRYVAVVLTDWSVVATNSDLAGVLDDVSSANLSLDDVSIQFVSETMRSMITSVFGIVPEGNVWPPPVTHH